MALVQGKASDIDLVALKTRLLEKEVPIRRDESEWVMAAVWRTTFALAPLFQKLAAAKRSGAFASNFSFFPSTTHNVFFFLIRKNGPHDGKKGSQ